MLGSLVPAICRCCLQSAIDKMDDNFGRAAIIEKSIIFLAKSQIRRWMLENDLIEAIAQNTA